LIFSLLTNFTRTILWHNQSLFPSNSSICVWNIRLCVDTLGTFLHLIRRSKSNTSALKHATWDWDKTIRDKYFWTVATFSFKS